MKYFCFVDKLLSSLNDLILKLESPQFLDLLFCSLCAIFDDDVATVQDKFLSWWPHSENGSGLTKVKNIITVEEDCKNENESEAVCDTTDLSLEFFTLELCKDMLSSYKLSLLRLRHILLNKISLLKPFL